MVPITLYAEMTPNPLTMKFVANKLLYPGKSIDFPDEISAARMSLPILGILGVRHIIKTLDKYTGK